MLYNNYEGMQDVKQLSLNTGYINISYQKESKNVKNE